jgi:hypothetical protein
MTRPNDHDDQPTRPLRAYQPGERTWNERASAHIAMFLLRHPEVGEQPFTELVLLNCADLVWELRQGQPRWSALSIPQLFRRLEIQHEFYPQPALLVAHYDTLSVFIPWLAERGLISKGSYGRLMAELQLVRSPLVDNARRQLQARNRSHTRQGAWYEVLKTIGP